jgi:ATP-dependent DNA ligase
LIDGEVVFWGDDGMPVLDRLRYGRQLQTEAVLFACDLVELGGKDLRCTPLEERKRALAAVKRERSKIGAKSDGDVDPQRASREPFRPAHGAMMTTTCLRIAL